MDGALTPCLAALQADKRVRGQRHRILTNGKNAAGYRSEQNRRAMMNLLLKYIVFLLLFHGKNNCFAV